MGHGVAQNRGGVDLGVLVPALAIAAFLLL